MIDISLTDDDERPGLPLAHRPDCPIVDQHRQDGRPIATLYGIETLDGLRLCPCLANVTNRRKG